MQIKKTNEQIERKFKKIYKRMRFLNDPKRYDGRQLTHSENEALYEAIGEWKIMYWLTEKYTI